MKARKPVYATVSTSTEYRIVIVSRLSDGTTRENKSNWRGWITPWDIADYVEQFERGVKAVMKKYGVEPFDIDVYVETATETVTSTINYKIDLHSMRSVGGTK